MRKTRNQQIVLASLLSYLTTSKDYEKNGKNPGSNYILHIQYHIVTLAQNYYILRFACL